MNKFNYVIFHKGCLDGFSCFVILSYLNLIADDAIIFQDVPSAKSVPKNIEGKNVIIMDTAYKYDILKEIFYHANNVLFIDHHVTIHEEVMLLSETMDKTKVKIIYDEKESGASLVWKYFKKTNKLPLFIRYIKDNDIGTWKLKYTHEFISSITVKYGTDLNKHTIKKWNNLFNVNVVKKLIKLGKVYKEYVDYLLNNNVQRYSMMAFPSQKIYEEYSNYFKRPGQYKVAVIIGGGCPNASLLGKKIMETIDCDFAMMINIHFDKKEYLIVMRSSETDVGEISKLFGGGGHMLASVFTISMNKYVLQDLFLGESLPRQNK